MFPGLLLWHYICEATYQPHEVGTSRMRAAPQSAVWLFRLYSYRSASIGFSVAAFHAG